MWKRRGNIIKQMGQNGNSWLIWVKSIFCILKAEIVIKFQHFHLKQHK